MQDILYLGSQSKSRQQLLHYAQIPFKVIEHTSNEQIVETYSQFSEYVQAIAHTKMRSLQFPSREVIGKDYLVALTADSLIRNPRNGMIFGKPVDKNHAMQMLAQERDGAIEVMTGCCLEKFVFKNGGWQRSAFRHWTASAIIEFYVDDDCVEKYLALAPIALQCSGAGVIENHGLSYLKSIQGSYTAAIGLPLYELRQALKDLEFIF